MRALIDADIFLYEFGSATDDEYKPLAWPLVQARIDSRIRGILEATGADSYQLYLTSEDKSNYRFKIATIKPYKGNRPAEKPHHYSRIREFLIKYRGAIEVFGMEADDKLGIEQMKDLSYLPRLVYNEDIGDNLLDYIEKHDYGHHMASTVICSRDKDLDMIPGWHYNWGAGKQKEKEMWWQDELNAIRSFYKQLLIGDSVDNIPGLYGINKSSKYVARIGEFTSESDMYALVSDQYEKRFGSYAEQFLTENARLLWILREEGEVWKVPG